MTIKNKSRVLRFKYDKLKVGKSFKFDVYNAKTKGEASCNNWHKNREVHIDETGLRYRKKFKQRSTKFGNLLIWRDEDVYL